MHGKLVQQAVAEVDLVILLHVDRRTELRVDSPGYAPWALQVRGAGGRSTHIPVQRRKSDAEVNNYHWGLQRRPVRRVLWPDEYPRYIIV